MGFWIGAVIFAIGAGISLAVYGHDLWRGWISRREPQMAPGRMPPELHFIAAVFSGAGATAVWDWQTGVVVALAQAGLGLLLALIARG